MEEQEGLRLYSFGNMYLQGVQSGIQCQHATAELFNDYRPDMVDVNQDVQVEGFERRVELLYQWADTHKTTILLNGGMKSHLKELLNFLEEHSTLPWSYFEESKDALNGVLTNVVIIVPERVYNFDTVVCTTTIHSKVTDGIHTLSPFEYELARRIKQCRLMN